MAKPSKATGRLQEMQTEQAWQASVLRPCKFTRNLMASCCAAGLCGCTRNAAWAVADLVLQHPHLSGYRLNTELLGSLPYWESETSMDPTGRPWRWFPLPLKHNWKVKCWSFPSFALPFAVNVTELKFCLLQVSCLPDDILGWFFFVLQQYVSVILACIPVVCLNFTSIFSRNNITGNAV